MTAYEIRISAWSSDVCSSDLVDCAALAPGLDRGAHRPGQQPVAAEHRLQPLGEDDVPRLAQAEQQMFRRGERKRDVKGKSVSVRVDRGGRGIIKKKKHENRRE